jgi:hypothetical protein
MTSLLNLVVVEIIASAVSYLVHATPTSWMTAPFPRLFFEGM